MERSRGVSSYGGEPAARLCRSTERFRWCLSQDSALSGGTSIASAGPEGESCIGSSLLESMQGPPRTGAKREGYFDFRGFVKGSPQRICGRRVAAESQERQPLRTCEETQSSSSSPEGVKEFERPPHPPFGHPLPQRGRGS